MKVSGVYLITCVANGRSYVGSSRNIFARWSQHSMRLNRGQHHSQKLQASWNKYGPTHFQFSVLSVCAPDRLLEAEQIFIDILGTVDGGFNCAPTAGSNAGCKLSATTRAKMSAAKKGKRPAGFQAMKSAFGQFMATPEGKEAQKRSLQMAHAANRGTTWSPERRASHKPIEFSAEALRRIGDASAARTHTAEAKTRMSLASKARWRNYRARGGTGRLSGACK